MKKFAYIDSANILHITKQRKDAERDVKKEYDENRNVTKMWPIVETDFPAKGGYPVHGKGNYYVVYSETEEKHGRKIPVEIAELYSKLK